VPKFIYSFAIIFTGLLLGYVTQILAGHKQIAFGVTNDDLRKLLQKAALLIINI